MYCVPTNFGANFVEFSIYMDVVGRVISDTSQIYQQRYINST